jgi:hypothetical protein
MKLLAVRRRGAGALMTNLGGHCIETIIEAFAKADDDRADLVHRLYREGLWPAAGRP